MKSLDQGICLFLGTVRGYEVLKTLIAHKKHIKSVLILEQQIHELENVTELIKELCIANHIPYKTTKQVKSSTYKDYLQEVNPNVVFVISWRFIIPRECFSIPRHGIFILHDSLLPKYRGFAPTNWVLINGEKQTGLTLLCISEKMDDGAIVDQIKIKMELKENARTLNEKFLQVYPKIILKNIDLILANKHKKKLQDSSKATYCAKRTPMDGKIDFNNSSESIVRLIRGTTYPYPGAYCFLNERKLIIWEAEVVENAPNYVGRIPGRVINIQQSYIDVLTGDSLVRIFSVSDGDDEKNIVMPNKLVKSITATLT